jgi:serine/threonine protein phosphatase 1
MLSKFLPFRREAATADSVPEGTRVYAVGDVHGCLDLLDRLLAALDADAAAREPAETRLIFLGDLVDRGPDSAKVVERVRHLQSAGAGVQVLAGNHEELFLQALANEPQALRLFARVGGRETAISYGIAADEWERLDYDALHERLNEVVPPEHRQFLEALEDSVTIGDYHFVHAGVRPDRALDAQKTSDLRWIREPFLNHRGRLGKRIVHGHTIAPEVEFRTHRIGIDTGAYATGRLTALGLEGEATWLVQT